jgi:transposase
MADRTLLPDPACLHLLQLEAEGKVITATVRSTAQEAHCPLCGSRAEKIHSHYQRILADLPWMGCAVQLLLHVRRFFCPNPDCQRKIFTERIPSVVAPSARRTLRLTDLFQLIGFALGGEAGKRLIEGMGLVSSPDTLLGLIRAKPDQKLPTPRVLGLDDFGATRSYRCSCKNSRKEGFTWSSTSSALPG